MGVDFRFYMMYTLANNYFVYREPSDSGNNGEFQLVSRDPTVDSGQTFGFYYLLNEDNSFVNLRFIKTLIDNKLIGTITFVVEGEDFELLTLTEAESPNSKFSFRIKLKEIS